MFFVSFPLIYFFFFCGSMEKAVDVMHFERENKMAGSLLCLSIDFVRWVNGYYGCL